MVIKVTSPKSLRNVIEYNINKLTNEAGKMLYSQNVHLQFHSSTDSLFDDMMKKIPSKTRVKKIAFSCSINPDPKDKVSDELLCKIAQEFMQEMGYGNQPYFVVKHTDIPREHIHIVSTRVDTKGKKIDDSFEGKRARRIIDKLEVKYGLTFQPQNLYAQKEYRRINDQKNVISPVDVSGGNISKQVYRILKEILPKSHFQSIGELNALLAVYNITSKFTKNEHKGKFYDGIVYFPTDNKGNIAGSPINASELARGVGISAVKNRMKQSKEVVNNAIPHMKRQIAMAICLNPKSIGEFQRNLEKSGIKAVVRQNEAGRIYGITFADIDKSIAVNGAKMGKDFSANYFNQYFPEKRVVYAMDEKQSQNETAKNTGTGISISGGRYNDNYRPDYKEIAWQKYLREKYGKDKSGKQRGRKI